MVRYISEKQLTIEEFKNLFRANLSTENLWVKLARVVPWDKFASIYMSLMSSDLGRPGFKTELLSEEESKERSC